VLCLSQGSTLIFNTICRCIFLCQILIIHCGGRHNPGPGFQTSIWPGRFWCQILIIHCWAHHNPGPWFPTSIWRVRFYVQWFNVRGDSLFVLLILVELLTITFNKKKSYGTSQHFCMYFVLLDCLFYFHMERYYYTPYIFDLKHWDNN
jgi:hypothetical protein